MKINKIQNAYIKNKPGFNYQILDQDGVLIAKGHLLSNRQKQQITKLAKVTIDNNGNVVPNMDSITSFTNNWILKSLDWWFLDLPLSNESLDYIDQQVISWLVDQIRIKHDQAMQFVQQNEKN